MRQQPVNFTSHARIVFSPLFHQEAVHKKDFSVFVDIDSTVSVATVSVQSDSVVENGRDTFVFFYSGKQLTTTVAS